MPDSIRENLQVPLQQSQSRPLEWESKLNLLRNAVVLRQLGIAFGIPIFVLMLFMLIIEWPPDRQTLHLVTNIGLVVGGVILVLLLITLLLFYGGRYEYRYYLDAQGIEAQTHGRTAKKNRIANLLLMLSGRPGPMGAGMLAQMRQTEHIPWSDVSSVEAQPEQKTLTLYSGKRAIMVVACTEGNFKTVLAAVQQALAKGNK